MINRISMEKTMSLLLLFTAFIFAENNLMAYHNSILHEAKPLRVGVYGIVIKEDKILMVPTQSGTMEIVNVPGGAVDEGESFAQALTRECQEEISCSITIGDYYDYRIWQHPDFPENRMFNIYYIISLESEPSNGIWVILRT